MKVRITLAGVVVLVLFAGVAAAQGPGFFSDSLPSVRAGMSGLYYTRKDPSGEPLMFTTGGAAAGTGTVLFDAGDFDFDWEPGLESFLDVDLGAGWGAGVRYFWLDDFVARASVFSPPRVFFGNDEVPVVVTSMTNMAYRSEIQGAEANLTYGLSDWLTPLVGIRWLEVNERLVASFDATGLGVMADEVGQTQNDLYGGQIGGDVSLWRGEIIDLGLIGKSGIFGNDARSAVEMFLPPGTQITHASDARAAAAYVADLRAYTTVWITGNWAVWGGYDVLFIDGLALAPNQFAVTAGTPATGRRGTRTHTSDSLLYHGGFLGVIGWF